MDFGDIEVECVLAPHNCDTLRVWKTSWLVEEIGEKLVIKIVAKLSGKLLECLTRFDPDRTKHVAIMLSGLTEASKEGEFKFRVVTN
ncbi:hypothetical protein E2C01_075509 [Portunus trituberculatus]|uniref:Uncharacterized protein n=1 Tax=Portunus trituberculatus TaxID=210409 RepID=A0A5B7IAV6_PORTR|nr:hypothetical protein [Portunus trituberculatus]